MLNLGFFIYKTINLTKRYTMQNNIHIGHILNQCIEKKGMKRTEIANRMGLPNTNIYAFEKRPSLHSTNLIKLCHALRHNFFRDIAEQFPADYSTAVSSPLEKQVAEQQEQIKNLQLENKLMRELLGK